MPCLGHCIRRLLTVVAASLVLGIAAHGAVQVIEQLDGAEDAVVLCAAAFGLIATLRLVGASGRRGSNSPLPSIPGVEDRPVEIWLRPRPSPAWLQRFQN